MITARLPDDELERLSALNGLQLLDTAPEPAFEAITASVAAATGAPIALVSLVDEHRQWFKSRHGLAAKETPRDVAFCAHAILADEPLVVADSEADPRFVDNPLVTGPPHVKAYLGAPITSPDGRRLGTLCAIDDRPHAWSAREIAQIKSLAALVGEMLRQRHALLRAEALADEVTALSREHERSRWLLEEISTLADVGGWELDLVAGKLSWTDQTRRIHEVAETFVPTLENAMAFYTPEARKVLGEILEDSMATGESWHVELPLVTAAGREIWVRASGRALMGKAGPVRLLGAFQDITEQRLRQAALEDAWAKAEAATRAKSAFLANMSHEIRTPLNGVIGLVGALSRTPLEPRQREMVDLIQSSGESLERLLTDILDFSKIEAGKLDLTIASFDLAEAIETAAHVFRVRADNKGIGLKIVFGPRARGHFDGDVVRVRQIVSNLTSNAVKFTSNGGIEIRIDVEEPERGEPESIITIAVADTGIGFDEATGRRLFARFEQADGSITRTFGGAGLGLSICRSLVAMMGGTIEASSTPGQGSVFTVRLALPRTVSLAEYDRQAEAGNSIIAGDGPGLPGGRLKVLLAEDHPTNQRVVGLILEPLDIALRIEADGASALAAFKAERFDLVLMDMQMPVMDGLSAVKEIRRHEAALGLPRTPIAMLSANAMADHIEQAIAAGCDLHIAKPVTPHSLLQGVACALALRPPREPSEAAA